MYLNSGAMAGKPDLTSWWWSGHGLVVTDDPDPAAAFARANRGFDKPLARGLVFSNGNVTEETA